MGIIKKDFPKHSNFESTVYGIMQKFLSSSLKQKVELHNVTYLYETKI